MNYPKVEKTLYSPKFEHDACGVGVVANIEGVKSRDVLDKALETVVNVTHRGAVLADAKTGDGAGVLTQIPSAIFVPAAQKFNVNVKNDGDLAVGVIFLPQGRETESRKIINEAILSRGLNVIGWREVPVDESILGEQALATLPKIEHVLVSTPQKNDNLWFERKLFVARKIAERELLINESDCYIASLSSRTIVYKGLLVAPQLQEFYRDLADENFRTSIALLHQRYSTNTFPNWELSQPFRMLAHNGEINTLEGNRGWMRAREFAESIWGSEVTELFPVIQEAFSDSASLDNALELLSLSGRDLLHSMAILIPEAWENMPNMDPMVRAFYEYSACLTEPWDGPAAVSFTDGITAAAVLDRNGLRPARYKIDEDNNFIMSSEVGATTIDDSKVIEKGRLGPGEMIAVDTLNSKVLKNKEIKKKLAEVLPFGDWVQKKMIPIGDLRTEKPQDSSTVDLQAIQKSFAYTTEESHLILRPLYLEGVEPVGSLGDDTPLSVLATKPRLIYSYFRQRFAQVTNPPIDSYREHLVMSLFTYLGARKSLLSDSEDHARLIRLESPILTNDQLSAIKADEKSLSNITLSTLFEVGSGSDGLKKALANLCENAEDAIDQGVELLILSDRGVTNKYAAIPMLIAIGAVHQHLIESRKRLQASLIAEVGDAREMHQFALLIGYGASAINPYLAFETIKELIDQGHDQEVGESKALETYVKTINKQLLKIMSKMGISTITGYHGAQIFEAIGLDQEVIDQCFTGTTSPVGGIGFKEIADESLKLHQSGFAADGELKLDDFGFYRYRRNGEPHAFSPISVRTLHKSLEENGTGRDGYNNYLEQIGNTDPIQIRDLLDISPQGAPIPLEEVEPAKEIVKRFNGGSMSFGALSIEAHEAIAIAFNRIGSKSGSGEGGEDPRRFRELRNGEQTGSKMKQIASGRFGVTPEYLAMAEVLEIKMAQGSKPGEGGQLPGHKVTEIIARARQTQPGVPLISPPPHHDIYSIEDLKQLIYDLKIVNPRATVAVKLVAEAGVGTVAAGVAKGYADYVLISGADGGTGASPWISIKYTGSPWELGLAETNQVLVMNDLRGRVTLRTDGGFRRGRDVAIAALLGAEEFGFGTQAMVAVGCQVARQCHLNTCPVGVATQDEDLRKKFWGTPEMLIKYLFYVAEELRELMSQLGFRTVEEMVGRSDLLVQKQIPGNEKANSVDLSKMLAIPDPSGTKPKTKNIDRNDDEGDEVLDDILMTSVQSAINLKEPVKIEHEIRNIHRTVGARISGEIARIHGDEGLPENSIEMRLTGSAGQSFGAFLINGVHLLLEGEANDYVGKGMHGGELVIRPASSSRFHAHDNVIIGNTVLYGATGGMMFASGKAGERFAVRNSGAWTVVEGVGDHACEYMTGGVVVVLGPTGRNLGAGMSGGVSYVLDLNDEVKDNLNPEMVGATDITDPDDEELLKALIGRHAERTYSQRAEEVLNNWGRYLPKFRKITPLPHVAPPLPREQQRAKRDALLRANSKL
ncbi:MAG: glutamate synthase large subunit [Chloroflexi bacterium]|nr:glutamate synthase large subunit [Chloroflexota bacterium]